MAKLSLVGKRSILPTPTIGRLSTASSLAPAVIKKCPPTPTSRQRKITRTLSSVASSASQETKKQGSSTGIHNGKIIGYQADIGKGYWGDIYDEHRRGKLVKGDLSTLKHLLKEDGWNSYTIRCTGDRHELYINGVKTCDWTETDKKFTTPGVIALQLHSGGIAKMEYKNIVIEEL